MNEEGAPLDTTDRQNDVITFALVYTWAMMIRNNQQFYGGDLKITRYEFEEILNQMGLTDIVMNFKCRILKGEFPPYD